MKKKTENKLLKHLYENRYRYLIGIIMLLLVDFLDLFLPQYIGDITDGLSLHNLTSSKLIELIGKMILCSAGISVCRFCWRYFIIGSSHRVINEYRKDIFEKMETLSQNYFNRNKTGDIMTYFTNDLDAIEEAFGFTVISAFDAVCLTSLCLYKMITRVSLRLTLYTLAPMVFIMVYGLIIGNKMDKAFTIRQEAFGRLNDEVQESVSAERVIKAFIQEEKAFEKFEKVNYANKKANVDLALLRSFGYPFMEVIIGAAHIISIVAGGYYTLIGDISLGSFITFASYINTLVWPMLAIGDCIAVFSSSSASIKRIKAVFNEIADIADDEHPDDVKTLEGEIRLDDVSFSYGKDLPEALNNISVEIRKGETFAIMGKTGCGKTTMVNLITRLYDASEGSISFDGHDIKKIPLEILHENIAYVPQDNFLFSESLKQNISFGKLDATEEEIQQAARMADVHDNIMEFPMKYDTMLGERGVTLSGGQKQRTSIARALLKDAPILIMDDSLSAVDTDTESTILANLKQIRENKTTIIIAHRVSTVQNADHILVLENGNIAEYGTYQQLMDKDGIFAKMVIKQQLEKQLAEVE